jgi:hypothetical protein
MEFVLLVAGAVMLLALVLFILRARKDTAKEVQKLF